MADYTAPAIGGGASGGVAKGTAVWRPGMSTTDKSQWATAQYDLTNQQVWAIVNQDFANPNDQVKIKSLLVQTGYLPKTKFQTNYWSSDDTNAFLDLLKKSNADGVFYQERLAADISGTGAGGNAGATKSTTRTVNFSDPKTAKAMVQSSFRSLLGRDPSDAEYSQFQKTLHQAEAASPSVTTTTRSGNTYSSTTTGGLGLRGTEMAVEEGIKANAGLETELVNKRINGYGDVIAKLAGF